MKKIKNSKGLNELFDSMTICEKTNGGRRFKDGDFLFFDDRLHQEGIEEFSSFLTGNNIYPIGAFSYSHSTLPIATKVGRYCSIGPNLRFYFNAHSLDKITSSSILYDRNFKIFSVAREKFGYREDLDNPPEMPVTTIGDDVWIGSDVTIRAGVNIGGGAIIGTKSLVTKDVPPYSIVGGNPAVVIRNRYDQGLINRLLGLRLSRFNVLDLEPLNSISHVYLDKIEEKINSGNVQEFIPKKIKLDDLLSKFG